MVASTHFNAAGERRLATLLGAAVFFSAAVSLAAGERLCVRAGCAIRKMIATVITNRTPERPFFKCGLPASRWMQRLYITHPHPAYTATAKGGFHNITGACACSRG